MSSYRQGPSLTAAVVAVYVAGSLTSVVWDLLGAAVVGSGQYLDARPSELAAIAWRVGGVVGTSAVAGLVVKAILDLEGGSGVSFGRSFTGRSSSGTWQERFRSLPGPILVRLPSRTATEAV